MIKKLQVLLLLFTVLAIVGLGCGPLNVQTPAPQAVVVVTNTPAVTNTPLVIVVTNTPLPVTPTATPTPSLTPSPEPTATPTPLPATATATPAIPQVLLEENLNVRTGPGTNFATVGLLESGSTAYIVGRNEAASWWQIDYPDGPNGQAWIAAGYGTAQNTDQVPVVIIPPTPTPAATSTPTPPPVDFIITNIRLYHNEENGGWSPGGSVSNCGYGHEINVLVEDPAGSPLDGVVIADTYDNPQRITGSHGPGRTQYILYGNGYNLFVAEDPSAGRPVTSETSQVLSAKDEEIPTHWLMAAGYCATEEECTERKNNNSLCRGHYSYDITFQRTW